MGRHPYGSDYPKLNDKTWLYERYVIAELTMGAIGAEVGASRSAVRYALQRFKIEPRSRVDAARVLNVGARRDKGTPTHNAWQNMRTRCHNPNREDWKDYGGRGIKICERWDDAAGGFLNFLADMGERPEGGFSLDRVDVNGNYEPSNC